MGRKASNQTSKQTKRDKSIQKCDFIVFHILVLFPDLNFLIQKMEVQFISETAWNFFKTTTEALFAERKEDKSVGFKTIVKHSSILTKYVLLVFCFPLYFSMIKTFYNFFLIVFF